MYLPQVLNQIQETNNNIKVNNYEIYKYTSAASTAYFC